MFDIGGSEMILIATICILLVDPSDLPALAKKLGELYGKWTALQVTVKREINLLALGDQQEENLHDRNH